MNTRPEIDGDGRAPHVASPGALQGRRRLLRASLGAAPVLLTVSSGPSIAGNKVQSYSAKCSAATSAPTRGTGDCNGRKHSTWCSDACDSTKNNSYKSACKTGGYSWPCAPTTLHRGSGSPQVRNTCTELWSPTADHYQVMNRYCARSSATVDKYWDCVENPSKQSAFWKRQNPSPPGPSTSLPILKLAAHCSAALLNCESGRVPPEVCDQDTIRSAWEACKAGGTWTPPSPNCQQVRWTIDEVCNWFNSMCTT
jgi:hypothetical protein